MLDVGLGLVAPQEFPASIVDLTRLQPDPQAANTRINIWYTGYISCTTHLPPDCRKSTYSWHVLAIAAWTGTIMAQLDVNPQFGAELKVSIRALSGWGL